MSRGDFLPLGYQTYKKYNIQVAKSQDLSRRKPAIFLTFFRGQGSPFRA